MCAGPLPEDGFDRDQDITGDEGVPGDADAPAPETEGWSFAQMTLKTCFRGKTQCATVQFLGFLILAQDM